MRGRRAESFTYNLNFHEQKQFFIKNFIVVPKTDEH